MQHCIGPLFVVLRSGEREAAPDFDELTEVIEADEGRALRMLKELGEKYELRRATLVMDDEAY